MIQKFAEAQRNGYSARYIGIDPFPIEEDRVPRRTYVYSRRELTRRVTLPLTPELDKFLKGLGDRCKDECGRFMDKSQLLRSLIAALKRVEGSLDFNGVKDETDLVTAIMKAFVKK